MGTDLTAIKAALADISDTELMALIAATYDVPQIASELLAWIDGALEWPQSSAMLYVGLWPDCDRRVRKRAVCSSAVAVRP